MQSPVAVESRVSTAGLLLWIQTGLITCLVAVLFAEVIVDLALEWWTQPEASYGILIPPFTLYIVYLRRHDLFSKRARRDGRGLALILVACLVLLTGRLASEFFLSRISFVALLGGLGWTFWGPERIRVLLFPLVLLATMVPPPSLIYNFMALPLQLFASFVATNLAQLCGVSIYRDGNIIYLATTSLGVAEACSGLHSLSALTVASLLLGFLEKATALGRVFIFILSMPLAIAVNVLRVTGTAVLADYNPELALGYYHSFSGWLVFILGLGLLWFTARIVFRLTGRPS